MTRDRRFHRGLLLSLGLVLAAAPAALAQDIRTLDKTFRKVAKTSIPKTVGVKSYVGQGDRAGFGTGAIISEDGYILTCSHVIDIAKRIEVILPDKRVFAAELLGKNTRQDYALLKIDTKGEKLPCYAIGKSAAVKEGQWVIALGHPGGPYADRQPAFAAGRVTGLHRKLPVQFMQRYYNDAIQTDCPIFAGNSGGPLVNLDGELIGINGAILTINDNAYAVPLDQIMAKMDDLKAGKLIEGERAGPEAFAEMRRHINPDDMNKMQRDMFKNFGKLFGGENGDLGKMFGRLFGGEGKPGQPGQGGDFGKMLEDMLKGFGGGRGQPGQPGQPGEGLDLGKMLEDLLGGNGGDLGKMLQDMLKGFGGQGRPGQPGQGGDFGKMLEDMLKGFGGQNPGQPQRPQRPAPRPQTQAKRPGYFGVVPSDESDKDLGGVLINQVVKGGPAARGDLRKGDIILSINGEATPDVFALRKAVRKLGVGDKAKVVVLRSRILDTNTVREKITLDITLGERN